LTLTLYQYNSDDDLFTELTSTTSEQIKIQLDQGHFVISISGTVDGNSFFNSNFISINAIPSFVQPAEIEMSLSEGNNLISQEYLKMIIVNIWPIQWNYLFLF